MITSKYQVLLLDLLLTYERIGEELSNIQGLPSHSIKNRRALNALQIEMFALTFAFNELLKENNKDL